MDVDDGVEPVVFSGEQRPGFGALNERLDVFQSRSEILFDGLSFASEFHESLHIFDLPGDLAVQFEGFFEARALLQCLAGPFLIGPEVWFADYFLEFFELAFLGACVKETSALPHYAISQW
jgi:hypothetical protein